jgi:pilus assembly protein Flp/PilA
LVVPKEQRRFTAEVVVTNTQGSPPKMTTAYQFLSAWITAHIDDERGASLVEYALLVALIAVVCIAAVTALGQTASEKFSEVDSSLSS